jgi:hypothetical protein
MKNNELKGRIVTIYGKQYLFARDIKATETKVSRVIAGVNNLESSEARAWERALGLVRGALKQLEAQR